MYRSSNVDADNGLAARIDDICQRIQSESNPAEERAHLKKLSLWGRAFSLFGYATAWLIPNPVSAFAISMGNFNRWAVIAHPVIHGGYDSVLSDDDGRASSRFARGWRRCIDWCDWIHPDAWHQEHNRQHHYNLCERADPDHLQRNMRWLRDSSIPMWMRYVLVAIFACIWKVAYYAPKTLLEERKQRAKQGDCIALSTFLSREAWSVFSEHGRELWTRYYLPYGFYRFVLLPICFLPLGQQAVVYVLINSIIAEIFANLHSFLVIVPNHAGDDIPTFDRHIKDRDEFMYRQIIGSVNYRTGGDLNDMMHGWLNYQIEHHVAPRMTLLQYQRLQPELKALCEEAGIRYIQEPVTSRLLKAVDIMVGKTSMLEAVHSTEAQVLDLPASKLIPAAAIQGTRDTSISPRP